MQYRTLGRTGLRVSLLGLGTGGARMMGQAQDMTQREQDRLVRRCLDLGINLFDTSEIYDNSETILGRALEGVPRESYVLSTKWGFENDGKIADLDQGLINAVERSLRRLRTEYVDIMMFHGLQSHHYHEVVERFYPVMQRLQAAGKIRYIGFSTRYRHDPSQAGALTGLQAHPELWDVIMLKWGILNQHAAKEILPLALEHNVGVMNMAAVRVKLPDPVLLEALIAEWKARGELPRDALPTQNPLGWLVHDDVDSVISAGYKFAADHRAVTTVLTGSATIAHLEQNARALEHPALCPRDTARLIELFGDIVEYA